MQQKKQEPQVTGVNEAEFLSHLRHDVKRKFEEYRQSFQRQKQEAVAQLKQLVETMHSTQETKLADLENNILHFVNSQGKSHGITPSNDPEAYSEAAFAKAEELYNEMGYREQDFGESTMKYSAESAGQAMHYTEQGLEKAMEAINHSAAQFEKFSEGMIY